MKWNFEILFTLGTYDLQWRIGVFLWLVYDVYVYVYSYAKKMGKVL